MNLKDEIFGPTQDEVWELFANELNGKYFYGAYADPAKVVIDYKNLSITLDSNFLSAANAVSLLTPKTRFHFTFPSKQNLQLLVVHQGDFNSIAAILGSQDLTTGFEDFDDAFMIKGNDQDKITRFFSNQKLRELLLKVRYLHFEIRNHEGIMETPLPDGINEIFIYVEGIITNLEELKLLYELCTEAINQLVEIDIFDDSL